MDAPPATAARDKRFIARLCTRAGASAAPDSGGVNPVVFIPGILGSRLIDPESAQSLWGDFSTRYADPKRGANRRLIALPMAPGVPLDRLASTSEVDGALREARARHLPFAVRAYAEMLEAIGADPGSAGARSVRNADSEGAFASFEFGYDWRRSLDETARDLDAFLRLASYFVQAQRGNSESVKFDVVAHSMGGLVLRYYLQYGSQKLSHDGSPPRLTWAGSERVERAVLLGTPNAGTVTAIERLVSGLPGRPLVHPGYDPFIVGTMPGLYLLLPRNRHKPFVADATDRCAPDLYDPEFWSRMQWGLAGPDPNDLLAHQLEGIDSPAQRRQIALDHLSKCLLNAKMFHAALDAELPPAPKSLELHLIAGDALATPAVVTCTPGDRTVSVVERGAGDGTVLRSCALHEADGASGATTIPWRSVSYTTCGHMALARDRGVINDLLGRILGSGV